MGITDEELAKIVVDVCSKCQGTGHYIYSRRDGTASIVGCENCDTTGVVSQIPGEKKETKKEE